MDPSARAVALMQAFAERTGLIGGGPPRRYLWTDAFAVCNWLGLARTRGDERQLALAIALVEQVHDVLGRHRPDDARRGFLSGLPDELARAHPTRGGLRIGKPRPERRPGEPPDQDLEWERDGQYFHYLTKWMHALDQVARATGQAKYELWARELADAAHRAFSRGSRLSWKMSIDLSRAAVPSMGQHDPLDGFTTCLQLDATSARLDVHEPNLTAAREGFEALIAHDSLTTTDPLGIGGLLMDASRLAQLGVRASLASELLNAASRGLARFVSRGELRGGAEERLAFRELGLAIGLSGLPGIEASSLSDEPALPGLRRYRELGAAVIGYWCRAEHRLASSWLDHQDINDVMLATSLAPDGMLALLPPRHATC